MRLRTTALPTFFVTVSPSRPRRASSRLRAMPSKCRPWTFVPPDCTSTNSTRCRRRISLAMPRGPRRGNASLLRGRHRDALAALRAAATENFTTATGLLASAEAMRALAALVVWLIRALHGVPSCRASTALTDRQKAHSILVDPYKVKLDDGSGPRTRDGTPRRPTLHFSDEFPEFTWPRFQLATSKRHLLPTPGFLACGQS